MPTTISEKRVAVTLGLFAAAVHVIWSVIVALGLGQQLADFVLGLHMVQVPVTVGPFDPATAAILVILAFFVGAAAGWFVASLWNMAKKLE